VNQIKRIREEIDKVDSEILKQLKKRIELILKISEYKKENNLPIEDSAREEEIISSMELTDLDEKFVRDIYKVIFNYSKARQK